MTILGLSRGRFFTILLIVLAGGFIFLKLRPYIAYISSLIETVQLLFNSTIGVAADTSKGIVDTTVKGTDVIVDKLSGPNKVRIPEPVDPGTKSSKWNPTSEKGDKNEKDEKNEPIEAKEKSTKSKKSPEPDDTTSAVQSKSGYCYVGEWKGVRSCVKVNGGCTNKVYSSEEECVKP